MALPLLIGSMLVIVALLMWVAERAGTNKKEIGAVSFLDSGLIGASQALAIIPGTSRSGITIATGLFRDLDRPSAARFSFLLATPIIAGAAASKLFHISSVTAGFPRAWPYLSRSGSESARLPAAL